MAFMCMVPAIMKSSTSPITQATACSASWAACTGERGQRMSTDRRRPLPPVPSPSRRRCWYSPAAPRRRRRRPACSRRGHSSGRKRASRYGRSSRRAQPCPPLNTDQGALTMQVRAAGNGDAPPAASAKSGLPAAVSGHFVRNRPAGRRPHRGHRRRAAGGAASSGPAHRHPRRYRLPHQGAGRWPRRPDPGLQRSASLAVGAHRRSGGAGKAGPGHPCRRLPLPRILRRPGALRAAARQGRHRRRRLVGLAGRLLPAGGAVAGAGAVGVRARQPRELRPRRRGLDALSFAGALHRRVPISATSRRPSRYSPTI